MAIRNILKDGDETLRKKAKPVDNINNRIKVMIDDMLETMEYAEGVGLAAPQIGVLRRVVVVDIGDGPIELVNPVIISVEGSQKDIEGCLSIPGILGEVERPEKVVIKAKNRDGKDTEVTGTGFLAVALCHELDHLDGILFKDKAIRYVTREELEKRREKRRKTSEGVS